MPRSSSQLFTKHACCMKTVFLFVPFYRHFRGIEVCCTRRSVRPKPRSVARHPIRTCSTSFRRPLFSSLRVWTPLTWLLLLRNSLMSPGGAQLVCISFRSPEFEVCIRKYCFLLREDANGVSLLYSAGLQFEADCHKLFAFASVSAACFWDNTVCFRINGSITNGYI